MEYHEMQLTKMKTCEPSRTLVIFFGLDKPFNSSFEKRWHFFVSVPNVELRFSTCFFFVVVFFGTFK